jgi:hypothetical protein
MSDPSDTSEPSDLSESAERSTSDSADAGSGLDGWPVELRGVTESIVTTLGPNDLWNVAALGLHPPETENGGDSPANAENGGDSPMTAQTWGNTRTRRNFHRQGRGYIQFTTDPVDFVDATLSIYEIEEPVLDSADAWVEVEVEQVDSGMSGNSGESSDSGNSDRSSESSSSGGSGESSGTRWEEWELRPCESGIERETVPTINRGFNAVVEATVAVSRLDVEEYDETELRNRLAYFEEVGRKCGDDRVRVALDRLREHLDE